mgnify:CR=1 FL=1
MKTQDRGYLHYKTWLSPAEPGKKRILNLTIVEAEGLEQGVLSRYPYVKIIHGEEIYKTPPSNKATAVRKTPHDFDSFSCPLKGVFRLHL